MPMRDRLARLVQRNPERPTLRQRAAALKASAAKVMRRKPPAVQAEGLSAIPAAPPLVDPIFAAIDETRRLQTVRDTLWQACQDLPDAAPEWDPEREAYAAWFAHIDNVLMQTVPTTAAGCVALARFVVDFCAEQGISITHATDTASVDNIGPLRLIAHSPALAGRAAEIDPHSDPVFAAIEAHTAARAAFGDTVDASDCAWVRQHGGDTSDAAMAPAVAANDAADAAEEGAWAALLQTRPTTIAGLLSFAQHVARFASEHDQGASAGGSEPAPAAIAAALAHVLGGASEREAVDWHDAPSGFMAYPAFEPVGFRRILDALPEEVTRLHCAASTDFARRMACVGADVPEEERQRIEAQLRQGLMLPVLTAAVDPESDGARALAALDASGAVGHDAELIALGRQFDEAHAAWMALVPASNAAQARVEAFKVRAVAEGMDDVAASKAAWLQDGVNDAHEVEEAAFQVLEPLNEAIMALPAHTAEGLVVKARAAVVTLWPSGDFEADRALGKNENWEKRGVRDLIDACGALARRQKVGGLPDLTNLSILQLRNLYDRYARVSDLWSDALNAPWVSDRDGAGLRTLNVAGDLIEAEQTRICNLYAAVVAEISRREPSESRLEPDWQLETKIRHELMCNGDLREAPELRAAIAERWSA